jgi:hypothetical protein
MSRALKIGGTVAAVGAGYYFYQAGGDPKAAQKRFEGMLTSYSLNNKPLLTMFATSRRSQAPARRKERRFQQRHRGPQGR